MADYIAKFIKGAKSEHGLDIHYTGIWNERMYDVGWIKLLRRTLDANGLDRVKIVAADLQPGQGDIWQLAGKLKDDPELAAAIDVLGVHYPKFESTDAAKSSGKPLWSSEDGPWRGDWEASKQIAAQLNRNYVQGKMTKTITWSLVTSYYDSLRLPDSGMMRAKEPWSGHYEVQPALWVIAHHNQFAKPGWCYLDQACRLLPGGGSVVAMASPDRADSSVIIETMGATQPQTLVLIPNAGLTNRSWHLWKTNQADAFVKVSSPEQKDGKLTLELEPNTLYSLTTTTGQSKGNTEAPPPRRFPIPYSEDFESYAPGRTPHYFSDQVGTFEVINRPDGKGKALAQVLPAPGIKWEEKPEQFYPFTVIGDSDAKDYMVSTDVEAGDDVTVGLLSRFGRIQHSESSTIAKGYRFEITAGSGAWKLSKADGILAQGNTAFPANMWHKLQLETRGQTITCRINGRVVTETHDASHIEGLAGLAAGYAGARFDNFSIQNTTTP
jgi:galactosylceramidase